MHTPSTANFHNPLAEEVRHIKATDPCVMVIFGATGDLTGRKLLPALYNLAHEGELPARFACVGFARRDKSHTEFRAEMHRDVSRYSRSQPIDEDVWHTFAQGLYYHRSPFDNDDGYAALKVFLNEIDQRHGTGGNRIYYLSTPPNYFPLIIEKLHKHGLIYDANDTKNWSRVIIEKPFGHDFNSAQVLQQEIGKYLSEDQVYRIDHYLGKDTVQNLLTLRFTNPIFESLWNNRHIDHVQITVSEELGIGTRGHFFEEAGNLRDIVQNHMMQLLSLVAMEPPNTFNAAAMRSEKIKVMEAIRQLSPADIDAVVRGQYGPGYIDQKPVCGYREEADVAPDSSIETYVALELHIDNWRWAGVPFFLRAGKRLAKRTTEIAIIFKKAPEFLHNSNDKRMASNALVIRIQPDEGISLKFNCKVPGLHTLLQPVKMDFLYCSFFGITPPEAYERLLCDCIAGDNALFASCDEVMAAWRLFDPILATWQQQKDPSFPNYAAGSWGPTAANTLIERSGRQWRLV
jgi:glucose-6-phosphate 1-dehydrogenase